MANPSAERFHSLAAAPATILPSLLNCDFGILRDEIQSAVDCGAKAVHWDVMDGRFVPNLTYGPPLIASLRNSTNAFFDAHLMIVEPQDHVDAFVDAGCENITIHIEAVPEPRPLIERIRKRGATAGLALNPGTPVDAVRPFLGDVDLALVMSVQPGHGGQKFRAECMSKATEIRRLVSAQVPIQVDGGISAATVGAAAAAGARWYVVGSAFYNALDRRRAFEEVDRMAREHSCWQDQN